MTPSLTQGSWLDRAFSKASTDQGWQDVVYTFRPMKVYAVEHRSTVGESPLAPGLFFIFRLSQPWHLPGWDASGCCWVPPSTGLQLLPAVQRCIYIHVTQVPVCQILGKLGIGPHMRHPQQRMWKHTFLGFREPFLRRLANICFTQKQQRKEAMYGNINNAFPVFLFHISQISIPRRYKSTSYVINGSIR